MKKSLILSTLLVISVMSTSRTLGQIHVPIGIYYTDIYLIGTSISGDNNPANGFLRITSELESIDKTPSISFILRSSEKDFDMWLSHYNYNLDQLKKNRPISLEDSMIIKDMPLSELKNLDVIDVNEFLRTKTRDEIWRWMMTNDDKRIWVIDRNDFYKSSTSQPVNDRMKVIETRVWLGNIPEKVLNP